MEQQETKPKNDMKKTLIICGSAIVVAAIALVCVLVLAGNGNSGVSDITSGTIMNGGEMTFEDFCFGMKEDLPQETMDEVKRLYEEAKQAMKEGDMDKLDEVYQELDSLDVFDFSNINIESLGNMEGVIIMDENGNMLDELPEGAETINVED